MFGANKSGKPGANGKSGSSADATAKAAVKSAGKGATLIAGGSTVTGDIEFSDQLIINGCVKGNISVSAGVKGVLTISAKGSVIGQIDAPQVIVNGHVEGDICAGEHLELAANAQVEGNVYYTSLEIAAGARIDGRLFHVPAGQDVARLSSKPKDTEMVEGAQASSAQQSSKTVAAKVSKGIAADGTVVEEAAQSASQPPQRGAA